MYWALSGGPNAPMGPPMSKVIRDFELCSHSSSFELLLCWFHGTVLFFSSLSSFPKSPPQLLSLHETVAAYRSVYFIGTIDPIVVILPGYVIRPERPLTSKAWEKLSFLTSLMLCLVRGFGERFEKRKGKNW
ncbi:hypothetical protein HYC85_026607 [Camellia sinensis]|uniref:Uncharacterized protein n=1 Tax=Camellia sinensis TaxID=4442 RepID=A0A7J7G7R2_CAMSI|nr:hypothetical protein HYC85_026607 [Camellia sinensis]